MRWAVMAVALSCGACAAGNDDTGSDAGAGGDAGSAWSGAGAGGSGAAGGGSGGAGGAGGSGATGAGGGGAAGAAGGSGGAGGQGGAPDVTGPTLVATTPADGSLAVLASSALSLTFSEGMDPASITTDTTTSCSASIQLSANGFASCVPMSAPTTADGITFTATPAGLASATLYQLRVTAAAEDLAQNALVPPATSTFTVRYARSIVIDGINDFGSENAIPTSTGGVAYLSYDDTHLYLGLQHADILAGGSGDKFAYFLLSSDATLAAGNALSSDGKAKFGSAGVQRMSHYYKEQIDGPIYSEYGVGDGINWNSWGTQGKSSFRATGYLEVSIALSELPSAAQLVITGYTVDYDGDNGNGWLFHLPLGAVDGSGAQPRDLYGYQLIALPTSNPPNDAAHAQLF